MKKEIQIGSHLIGDGCPCFIIAEMSANHLMDFDRAVKIMEAAKKAGADAIKLQTYTPDTITLNSEKPYFQITQGTIWDGTTLYKLYQQAYTPWEWQPELNRIAGEMGLVCFSSPFDASAVNFMEEMQMPAYKIASFEITDIPLVRQAAATGKPVIFSTGIAHKEDIALALETCLAEGNEQVVLLKCTTAYPSPYEDINLNAIRMLARDFDCICGLSDHTMGQTIAVGAVAMGAKVIEKHLTLSRADGGADAAFSMEPEEFQEMVEQIRIVEKALGHETYELTEKQLNSRQHSRSLFVVKDVKAGENFTPENIRSVRPADGLHTKHYEQVMGMRAAEDIEAGEPLSWKMVQEEG